MYGYMCEHVMSPFSKLGCVQDKIFSLSQCEGPTLWRLIVVAIPRLAAFQQVGHGICDPLRDTPQ